MWRSCEASYVLHFRGYSASGKWQGSSQPDKLMKPKTQQIKDDQPLMFTQLGSKSMYTAVNCPCMCLSHCVSAWRVGIVASWWRRQSKQQTKCSWPKWNSPSGVLVSGNGPPALKTTGPKLYFSYSALAAVLQFLVARGPCLSTHCPQTTHPGPRGLRRTRKHGVSRMRGGRQQRRLHELAVRRPILRRGQRGRRFQCHARSEEMGAAAGGRVFRGERVWLPCATTGLLGQGKGGRAGEPTMRLLCSEWLRIAKALCRAWP